MGQSGTGTAIEILRLRAGDAARMHAIVASLPPPEWRDETMPTIAYLARALSDARVIVLGAFDGEAPAGFVSAYRFPSLTAELDQVYVYDVWVGPEHRGRGIGRRLMDALTALCRDEGIAEGWIGTDGDNIAAQRLYLAAGGTEAGRDFVEYEFDFRDRAMTGGPAGGGR